MTLDLAERAATGSIAEESIGAIIAAQAERRGAAVALMAVDGSPITYRRLDELVRGIGTRRASAARTAWPWCFPTARRWP